MSAFTLDIKGQLNNMRLSDAKALWPLFEAVVNSIHSIEDSACKDCGEITIFAQRDVGMHESYDKEKPPLERINSFTITDNGQGFTAEDYTSFNTAYSTLKIKKGCKGIGRFLWLKAFESVEIKSVFQEDGKTFCRDFVFSPNGILPEDNRKAIGKTDNKTEVKLKDFAAQFKRACPVELDVIAKKIIEHCLLFFISGSCPKITLYDGVSDAINLNQYFEANIKDSLHQDHFTIKDNPFVLYHLRVPEGANSHELHLCANLQEVTSVELKNYIPDLQKKIVPIDYPKGFYYVGYVTSSYLDAAVNTTRTGFEFDEKWAQISLYGTGKDTVVSAAVEFIKAYLADYLSEIGKKKKRVIDAFVANDRPTYRYLLQMRPEVYSHIPVGLTPVDLELELHKHAQLWETDIKKQGQELEKAIKEQAGMGTASYQEMFEEYWTGVTEISKTCLAEYVTRRKTLLSILEETLTIQDDGTFKKEDAIHSVICPMRHTSDDIEFEEMNLWIVDERLAYHKFLASDKTLRSMPCVDSSSTKEPDIAVFDQAFAYTDSEEPFTTVTIIEFKKPDNDSKNPINQVGEYIDLIRSGKKKKANGNSFNVTEGTLFRCYVICDMTSKMRTHCLNSGLLPAADNMGYSGFNQGRHAYIEVLSYNKLLADARKRNEILFEKLFSPKVNEVLHHPKGK